MALVPSLRLSIPATHAGRVRRAVYSGLALYVAPALLVVTLAVVGLGAHRQSWHVPFEYDGDDTLLILPMVQGAWETGSFWRHGRMGAPGTLDLGDFPVIDAWHFAALRLVGMFVPDPVRAFNVYHLLTYPLASLVATACLRRLGQSGPAAVALAVLFAFAPYHVARGEHHYFLSAYYLLPLPLTLAVRFAAGWSPFVRDGGRVAPAALGTVAIGLVTSAAGAYYAFFACVVLTMAGLFAACGPGRRGAVAASITVAAIVAGGVALHVPAMAHAATNGRNDAAHARAAREADYYGLALVQLVLPIPDHRVPVLARLRAVYDGEKRPGTWPSESAALGTVAASGWLGLVVAALLPRPRPGPVRILAVLTVGVSLIAVTGGGGSLFNALVTPQVRAYARFAIVLAFFGLAAVGFAIDAFTAGRVRLVACGLLTAFGLADQTPRTWFTKAGRSPQEGVLARFASDRSFFADMEAALPPGAMVYQLPYDVYPETSYRHARGLLHTTALRFSFGAMKHRAADNWLRETSALAPDAMLGRLCLRDFAAVCVDRSALAPADLTALTDRLGPGTPDTLGTFVWFDLRPWREAFRARIGPGEFSRRATADREAIVVEWLGRFKSYEPVGSEWRCHLGETSGAIHFVNPTDRPRRVRVTGLLASHGPYRSVLTLTGFGLTADGTPWRDRIEVGPGPGPGPFTATFDLPPGRSGIDVTCHVPKPPLRFPQEPDRFAVHAFRVEEVGPD
jgi:hypothetical protein